MALTALENTNDFILVSNNQGISNPSNSTLTDFIRLSFAISSRAPKLWSIYNTAFYEKAKQFRDSANPDVNAAAITFDSTVDLMWANKRYSGCCPLCILTFKNPSFQALVFADTFSITGKVRIGQLALAKCPLANQDYHFNRSETEVLSQFVDILWGKDSYGRRTDDFKNIIARYSIQFILPDSFPTR